MLDQKNFQDTTHIIKSIKALNEIRYIDQDLIFDLPPIRSKRNRKEYDSLKVLRDSISNEYYSRQNIRGVHIAILTHEVPYYHSLKHHSLDLIKSLWPTFNTERYSQKNKIILLGLLDLPDSINEALKGFEGTPEYVKARLGDQRSEEIIIDKFKALLADTIMSGAKYQDLIANYGKQLLYINSTNAIDAFFEAMQSKIVFYEIYVAGVDYEACENCPETMRSEWPLATTLIYELSKYYPYALVANHIFNRYLDESESYQEAVNNYFTDVEELVNTLYNIDIKIKADFINKGQTPPPKDFEY